MKNTMQINYDRFAKALLLEQEYSQEDETTHEKMEWWPDGSLKSHYWTVKLSLKQEYPSRWTSNDVEGYYAD